MKTLAKFLCHHWQLRDCFSKKKHSGMIALPIDCLAKFAELRHQSNAYRAILHHNTFFPWTQQKEFVKNCLKQCSLHYMNSTSIRTSWNSPTSCKISNISCNPHTLVSHSSPLTPQKLLMVTGSKPSNKIFQQASHNLHVAIESWSQRHYCQRPVCCSSRLYSTGHDPWTLVLLSSLGELHIQVHHESLPTMLHIYGQRRVCAR